MCRFCLLDDDRVVHAEAVVFRHGGYGIRASEASKPTPLFKESHGYRVSGCSSPAQIPRFEPRTLQTAVKRNLLLSNGPLCWVPP